MKKIVTSVVALLVMGSVAFAQDAKPKAEKKSAPKTEKKAKAPKTEKKEAKPAAAKKN